MASVVTVVQQHQSSTDNIPSKYTAHELLSALTEEPEREDLYQELEDKILAGDNDIDDAAHSILSSEAKGSAFASISRAVPTPSGWTNCIGQQLCRPSLIRKPRTLTGLINAVQSAREKNLSIRAVGSGHSFSNVAPCFDGGVLLDPHDMDKTLVLDANTLRDPSMAASLFAVESGITIEHLNTRLNTFGLALANMGAYDGQTLAGAISTGTHGTGIALGPIASSVRALVLVAEDGKAYQIEPTNGITDPTKFDGGESGITLIQDDDRFHATVVAMGCMGVIYSYTLSVVPAYFLREDRTLDTWEEVKKSLVFPADGSLPAPLTDNRHYEIDINPYTVKKGTTHACIVQKKNIHPGPPHGSRGWANWLAGLLAGWPTAEKWLVKALNRWPRWSPATIQRALGALVDKDYVAQSYTVLNVGAVDKVKALAVEIALPVDATLVPAIDHLLDVFAREGAARSWYMAGPIALRFVAASEAFLAPQQGRLTCMVELDMLVGITTGTELLRTVVKEMMEANPRARMHWGLDLDSVTGPEAAQRYERYADWLKVYRMSNSSGVFDSPFTERLGISMRAKAETGVGA